MPFVCAVGAVSLNVDPKERLGSSGVPSIDQRESGSCPEESWS